MENQKPAVCFARLGFGVLATYRCPSPESREKSQQAAVAAQYSKPNPVRPVGAAMAMRCASWRRETSERGRVIQACVRRCTQGISARSACPISVHETRRKERKAQHAVGRVGREGAQTK
jgi:hypothetical protein